MSRSDRSLRRALAVARRQGPLLLSLAALAACSATPSKPDEVAEEKVYRTGSNLPVRDRSTAGSGVVTVDPGTLQGQMNRGLPPPAAGSR